MESEQIAWFAGMYEGEGCLVKRVDARWGTISWSLSISSVDLDVIQKIVEITGVSSPLFIRRGDPKWQDQWRWSTGRRDEIASLVVAIYPWLGARRRAKVDEFLAWYHERPSRSMPWHRTGKCRSGVHSKDYEGPCRACSAARSKAYRARAKKLDDARRQDY